MMTPLEKLRKRIETSVKIIESLAENTNPYKDEAMIILGRLISYNQILKMIEDIEKEEKTHAKV